MNIRQAVLLAADKIERTPDVYKFNAYKVPGADDGGCGTPACMLGWIALYAGQQAGEEVHTVCERLLGVGSTEFYARVRTVSGTGFCALLGAKEVPAALRAYADKYHPAESRALIPASVRAIFEMTPAELAREFA